MPEPTSHTLSRRRMQVSSRTRLLASYRRTVGERIGRHLNRAVEWIKNAMDADENAKVMVHCMCGKSRSVSVVVAYIMATQESPSLTETFPQVKAKRRIVSPNLGFMKQLKEYEGKLRPLEETAMSTD